MNQKVLHEVGLAAGEMKHTAQYKREPHEISLETWGTGAMSRHSSLDEDHQEQAGQPLAPDQTFGRVRVEAKS